MTLGVYEMKRCSRCNGARPHSRKHGCMSCKRRKDDLAALRHWQASATEVERRWATRSLNLPCESPLLQAIGEGE